MTDNPRRPPLQGRIIPPGQPLPTRPQLLRPPRTQPPPPRQDTSPPTTVHVTVHLNGADLSPVEAVRPWWRPAYTLRTALLTATGLIPLPSIGAPAGRWALLLGDAAAEQSLGAAWTIAAAALAGTFAADRSRRRWDADEHAWRPGWIARGLLCAAISGTCLALPVANGLVHILTGVTP